MNGTAVIEGAIFLLLSPAKAGAQSRRAREDALPRVTLRGWAPAFAGEKLNPIAGGNLHV